MRFEPAVISAIIFFALLVGGASVLSKFRDRWIQDTKRLAREQDPARAERLVARLKRLVRPTLLLVPAKEPGFSKLGGDPELPAGVEWPAGDDGPRMFLAQIDLAAFRPHVEFDWLPPAGRFYAFYDSERHGLADVVRVLFSADEPGPPVPAPAGVAQRFPERRVAFMVFRSAPSLDWLNIDPTDVDFEEVDEGATAIADTPPPDELQHRIGGYPNEIQMECMRLSCERLARGLPELDLSEEVPAAMERASKQWRMLLQIDSDPGLKMNWGDGGRLYVFVREQHARDGDFSKTVSIWQTY